MGACSNIVSLKNYKGATIESIKVSDDWTINEVFRDIGSSGIYSLAEFIAFNIEEAQEKEGSLIEEIIIKCQDSTPMLSVSLSKQGREYLGRNFDALLDKYVLMSSNENDSQLILFTDIEAERKDVTCNNGCFVLVDKSPRKVNSVLYQNTFSSAPQDSSGDCQSNRHRDKILVGRSDYKKN